MTFEQLAQTAKEAGFETAVPLDPATLHPLQEVRAMCAEDRCGRYGKSWSCPPACGSLEDCTRDLEHAVGGILVQTVGDVEDSFDFEGMVELEALHKSRFNALVLALEGPVLALGAGSCTICAACAYPDAPCRFPQKRISSMEAYGLLVAEVCKANGLAYYYGKDKIAYTSCILQF